MDDFCYDGRRQSRKPLEKRFTLGIYEPSVPERRPVLFSFKTYPGTEEDYQQLAKVAATLTFELNQQKDMTAAVAVFEYPFPITCGRMNPKTCARKKCRK